MEQPNILIIHGPNLNMLGTREPDVYGKMTLADINSMISDKAVKLNCCVDIFQSNHEGEIVQKIQAAQGKCRGVIINPAAYTHTSVAIRDAILLLDIPVIEVHLSNIYKREPFRHKSMLCDVVSGQICGLGATGYCLALEAMVTL